jgi:hypothetical protein
MAHENGHVSVNGCCRGDVAANGDGFPMLHDNSEFDSTERSAKALQKTN